ncbi:hypothetical protein D9M72_605850 [compost metagenome]
MGTHQSIHRNKRDVIANLQVLREAVGDEVQPPRQTTHGCEVNADSVVLAKGSNTRDRDDEGGGDTDQGVA